MDRSNASSSSNATRRAAYLASARRRRPPPRFRPWMIIVIVLAVGLVVIGLTMTIIGVWPGYSAVGGNPLKIVGPIMLGIGAIALVAAIANICYRSNEGKKAMLRSMSDTRSSKNTVISHHSGRLTPTPSLQARPSKGILKAPSTSTYNGTTKGSTGDYESDSGMPNTHSFSTNRSYERDSSDASDNSARMDNVKIDMMPDPTQAYRHGKPVDQSSTGSDQGVPPASMSAPRHGNHHQQQRPGRPYVAKPTYSNQGYTADAKETDIDGDLQDPRPRRAMQQYSTGGYDAYDKQNTSGQLGIAGGGALGSPYSTPQGQQPPRTRWGSPKSPAGQSNQAYTSDQPVAVVTEMYQEATTPGGGQLHYTSYAHSEPTTPHEPTTPSTSTEV